MNPSLTLFFDGRCPLCMAEINELKKLDRNGSLSFVDVNSDSLSKNHSYIDKESALSMLHGITGDGQMLFGLDVTVAAWAAVGKHRWLQILRWPIIRYVADAAYWLFARYRSQISSLVMGRRTVCSSDNCLPENNSDHS